MQSAEKITNIRLEIQKLKNLPPLPFIAQQLIAALHNEDSSMTAIAAIINQDPSLTSQIMGLANSAFFGFGRKLYSVHEAIINLGLDLVRGLALTLVMGGVFDIKKCKDFDISRYWLSAFMTADLAMQTATIIDSSKKNPHGQYFLYGLLHNLGILILADTFPKLMGDIFSVAKGHPERRLVFTEQAMLDTDHHQAGGWLARKWHLPDEVIAVIEHHHYPDYSGEYMKEVLLIGFCSRTTHNLIHGKEKLLSEDDAILSILGIDQTEMTDIANRCRAKLSEYRTIAREMRT